MKKVIGNRNDINAAFLPIGNVYTMGPKQAVQAAKWLSPRLVIPIHYNSFPVIRQNPYKFVAALKRIGIPGKVLKPGQTVRLT